MVSRQYAGVSLQNATAETTFMIDARFAIALGLSAAVGALLFGGCAARPPGPPSAEQRSATADLRRPVEAISADRWETRTFERRIGPCDDTLPKPDCIVVFFSYPVSTAASVTPVDESVTWFVNDCLLSPVFSETRPPDLETLAAEFAYEYERVQQDLQNYRSHWFLKRAVEVIRADDRVVSLCFSEQIYTGGAHANTTRRYRSFHPATGRPIELEEIVAPAGRRAFEVLATALFRQIRGIPPGVSLAEAGFWFEHGRFRLNDNFALTGDGVLFYFNPYEIASYAAGPTSLLIPFSRTGGMIDRKWTN
jgi:hypothetical protein